VKTPLFAAWREPALFSDFFTQRRKAAKQSSIAEPWKPLYLSLRGNTFVAEAIHR
jgi:hypothetical protein